MNRNDDDQRDETDESDAAHVPMPRGREAKVEARVLKPSEMDTQKR